jgi:hypothetical protein
MNGLRANLDGFVAWSAAALRAMLFLLCVNGVAVAFAVTFGVVGWCGIMICESIAEPNLLFSTSPVDKWLVLGAVGFAGLSGLAAAAFVGWRTTRAIFREPLSGQQNLFERTRIRLWAVSHSLP